MVDFSKLTKKQLSKARNDLLEYLRKETDLRPTRITQLTNDGCVIEGGIFPAIYDRQNLSLKIWGRGSRYAGETMSVKQLKQVEDRLFAWFAIYNPDREEEPNEEI